MNFRVWCQTDVGLRRERNEDSFIYDESVGLYAVADGMGGHRGGEIASQMAVETVLEFVRSALGEHGARRVFPRDLLVSACEEACRRVFDRSQEGRGELQGMGTTLVAALRYRDTVYIAHVGDSRAYLFTNGQLWQLTEDHSLVYEQLRAGLISEKDYRGYAGKNVITRCIGYEREVQVDVLERVLNEGDLILMCSDGLTGLVSDQRIAEFCRTLSGSEIVSKCVDEAKKNGGDDNITVMVLYAEPQSN